ncbi:MAG: hypothetical protein WBQ09_15045 [Terriglobales bacterium]
METAGSASATLYRRFNHFHYGDGQNSSSAGKQQRGPISKQRNRWLQTTLIEAAKLAPRWNLQLAALHARELERGNRNRATLAVARKLVAYLLAIDKSRQAFQVRAPSEQSTPKAS